MVSNARYGFTAAAPVADQQCDVVHLAHLTGLHDEPGLSTLSGRDQMVMYARTSAAVTGSAHSSRRIRDRTAARIRVPALIALGGFSAHPIQRTGQGFTATVHRVTPVDERTAEAGQITVGVNVPDLRQLVVVYHRMGNDYVSTRRRSWIE